MFLLKEHGLGTIDIGSKIIDKPTLNAKRMKELGKEIERKY